MLSVHGILVGTDFSKTSENAFRLACGLASDYGVPLHVLHVATSLEAYKKEQLFKEPSSPYLLDDWNRLREYAVPHVVIYPHVLEGEPSEQIVQLATSLACDFIVIGSHGRTGLRRLLMGSVAEQVLRHAKCQVVIVKAPVSLLVDVHPQTGEFPVPVTESSPSDLNSPTIRADGISA
jgi:universal stress protein A